MVRQLRLVAVLFGDAFAHAAIFYWKTWRCGSSSASWNEGIQNRDLPLLTSCSG
jgi:hypothetical protein